MILYFFQQSLQCIEAIRQKIAVSKVVVDAEEESVSDSLVTAYGFATAYQKLAIDKKW